VTLAVHVTLNNCIVIMCKGSISGSLRQQGLRIILSESYFCVFVGRMPLGYPHPAANYQLAPNRRRLGGSWVTRRQPKSAGLESSGV